MSDLQAIADRFEIEALRGEFTDAAMMRDYDRLASLFTQDGAWRMPDINVEFVSRGEIRAALRPYGDALGLDRGLVVHAARAHRPGPQGAALAVADHGGLEGVLLALAETNARRPGRWARGRRTWVLVPSMRSSTSLAAASATTSAKVRSRSVGWPGTAKPRAASSGRIWPMARVMVARSTPSSTAKAWCGSCRRSTIRVASTRSHKTSRWWGPAPAARRRSWPRRWSRAAWCWAVGGSASSAMSSPRCCRAMPVKQGWERAARTHVGVRIPAGSCGPAHARTIPAINPRLAHQVVG
jgi:hypothetical protein